MDAVSTLGAVDLYVDDWKIDAAFSESHNVLGAPAGFAPVTFGPLAMCAIQNRKVPSNVYHFDATELRNSFQSNDQPRL